MGGRKNRGLLENYDSYDYGGNTMEDIYILNLNKV